MRPISEANLRRTKHPIYAWNVQKMRSHERELYAALELVANWDSATLKNQRSFLKLCHESPSVAVIMINKTAFPTEPRLILRGSLDCEAREKVHPEPFKVRIAPINKGDNSIHFQRPEVVNKSSWYGSEARGEYAALCSFFGHKATGYIDPKEATVMWFEHLSGTLHFNKISAVSIQKTEVLLFEHPMLILHISTKKKAK